MPNLHCYSDIKTGLIITGLLLGLLAACGDNPTNQPAIGGQVPPNTAAPQPTATPAPMVTIDTRPAVTPWDPKIPIPTPTPYPTGQPVAGNIPNFGTTVNAHGKISNAEAQEKFLEAYAQGKPGQWEYVVYGIDSGPTPQRFVYRGNGRQYTLLTDNTKDGFAAPEDRIIKEYTCQNLTKSAKFLNFGDCIDNKGEKNLGWSLPLG